MPANPASDSGSAATVTQLLNEAGAGDPRASAELLPLVYERLRALAEHKMGREPAGQTLQATSLVHEAYLRLVDAKKVQLWQSRWHFFAAAAEAMRRILVENARRRSRLKRGGGRQRVDLDALTLTLHESADEFLALNEALDGLAATHPARARLVNLRYFGGLTNEEAAQALGVSVSTAERHWAFARAWLYRHMSPDT